MRWWYSHLIFPAQYVSFKDAGEEELFWNIVTWYHFFNHHKDLYAKFSGISVKISWLTSISETWKIGLRKPFISMTSRVNLYR